MMIVVGARSFLFVPTGACPLGSLSILSFIVIVLSLRSCFSPASWWLQHLEEQYAGCVWVYSALSSKITPGSAQRAIDDVRDQTWG